ncbi:L,D-transpeptidase [Antrihabitans sp. YC2-6]|uniref:L,D-transpeptidase n=1 Tax=Antrihabitans sp. YC2-6 TaxID=2799498 RepID=UPI0018F60B2C|nr:L,D-transpeptidase [Antrihabitans sp. YC2-6]MBJ8346477.1 L,D-transpeptidase [Antrihabitans sp. YC2-6]
MRSNRENTVTTSNRSGRSRWGARATLAALGVVATGLAVVTPVSADPLWPGGPDIPGLPALIAPVPPGSTPPPPFAIPGSFTPTVGPAAGSVVGGHQPIDIFYKSQIVDRVAAENSVHIAPSTGVPGDFQWVDDRHLQWVPADYWPRGTAVSVEVAGARTVFQVSDSFTAVGDAAAHTFVVKLGNDVIRTFPASMGKRGHETPNGTFPVIEKNRDIVMDSSTYGVPVNSPEGYKVDVEYATRLTWSGIFVHAAPWSVGSQGNSNVSHGCINLSTENAAWYFNNVRPGDTVALVNG